MFESDDNYAEVPRWELRSLVDHVEKTRKNCVWIVKQIQESRVIEKSGKIGAKKIGTVVIEDRRWLDFHWWLFYKKLNYNYPL